MTVLAVQNDPFRIDTSAAHRDGAWLANAITALGLSSREIHLRGLHYALIGVEKPNGSPYRNTDEDWRWLQEKAADAARWLGYIDFEQITDQRNAAPIVRTHSDPTPWPYLSVGLDIDIPDVDDLEPQIGVLDFTGVQPYKLVLIGEKSSLVPVLDPIALRYAADLYLPTGEISDTYIHQIAKHAAEDGRPLVALYFADCDPSGWQMGISVARKLQAFRTLLFPDLDFQVRRVCLTPDQVREYGLPSTPLKPKELRADRWRAKMGVAQTEIDALASLQPDLLRQIARDAIEPFFDATLDRRVADACDAWLREAQSIVDARVDAEHLGRIRAEADHRLTELREQIDALNGAVRLDIGDFDLPPIEVPAAALNGNGAPAPLVDSRWPFSVQCQRLIASKAYEGGAS